MSYVFYVFGVIGLAAAALIFTNGARSPDSMVSGFAMMYALSAFVGAMGFFAVGRILDHLRTIARNSRHLKFLDPDLAEAHARKGERGFFGVGRKEPTP
ncbi:hypothetical protein [Devosia riboflavina]